MRRIFSFVLFCAATLSATIFGSVRGIIHDPQHRPVQGAMVMLKAKSSDWSANTYTDANGEFNFNAVALGEYSAVVANPGFNQVIQSVVVQSGTQPVLHFQLSVAVTDETVNVSAAATNVAPSDSATPITLVNRADVARTPGAARTNSLAIITNYVPGAYLTHDQLHVRGGHQVSWLVDGVPVPNTNIASNVGPQFDPKDIDYMEIQRGSYDADYGDRTYGVFNVVPRTGFERNNEAELVASLGNFYQTNDQLSLGSHTQRFAYYASVNANRSNLGLETPVAQVIHDAESGYGGFGSLIFNANPSNQLRLVSSLRRDFYQVPNTPEQQAADISDGEHEADAFVNFSWVHTFNSKALLTVSPFYHYNRAKFDGGPNDSPISTIDDHASNYAGGQVNLNATFGRNNLQAGIYGFAQHDNQLFGLVFNDQSNPNFRDRELVSGSLQSFFLDDKFKLTHWLTLMAGIRPTYFSSSISENAISPRFGAALTVPRLHWVFRAFYGHYYQAPPLITASGPLLQFVSSQSLGFIPLHGERDEEHQFGVSIPFRGWSIDADNFKTLAHNFFDHNNVANSNIFFPLTIDEAVIRGWELTLRSPRIAHRAQVHLAYSNQIAQAQGAINGGLTDFSPPAGLFLLDHDQRHTLNVGADIDLPGRSYASTNVSYASGFTNGDPPPDHLPQHTTFDLSLGKDFGERFAASVNALNLANRHLLTDNSVTFGGFHWNNPREIYVEVRYRFHF